MAKFLNYFKFQIQKIRKFCEKKKLVSNDLEMSNSARNVKKNRQQMAVSGGTTAVFFKVSKNWCQENTFLFSYLCSEIKTKPKNHGLHESGKTHIPLPPFHYFFLLLPIILLLYFISFLFFLTKFPDFLYLKLEIVQKFCHMLEMSNSARNSKKKILCR